MLRQLHEWNICSNTCAHTGLTMNEQQEFIPAYSPHVLQLKKEKGVIVQDCDVYIGHKISNSNWQFDESKWTNPYHSRWDLMPSQRLQKYRVYVLNNPHLLKSLVDLHRQRLGCLCKKAENCHGNVLVELVKEHCKTDYFAVMMKGPQYFFKGQNSPLSNCYPVSLKAPKSGEKKDEGRTKHFPLGAFQLYVWRRARNASHKKIGKDVLTCSNISQVHKCNKKYQM